jgi:hypothetical protein
VWSSLDKRVPIRFTLLVWPPLLLVVFLPNVWWGILVKVLAAFWLLGTLRSAFGPAFSAIPGFGGWATLNVLWFGLALISPRWLVYVFSFLIVTGFVTLFRTIERAQMAQNGEDISGYLKRQAMTRWRWKNPLLAAGLAVIFGPFGYLYFSWKKSLVGLVVVSILAEIARFNGWWPPAIWMRLLAGLGFAAYAYMDTRYTNAAIEYYKYGLPGTGTQKPS